MRGTIVIAGAVAQKPGQGGHTWVFLQYLLGFRQLGWDVLFLDRIDPAAARDAAGEPCPVDRSAQVRYLTDVLGRFGLTDRFALLGPEGAVVAGLPRTEVIERVRAAALLLNVMGFLDDEEILGWARRRVFLDIDPGFGQIWRDLGLHDAFRGHDAHVTVGANIGRPECPIPTGGLNWVTTVPPVVLDCWPARPAPTERWTTVASWRGAYGPLDYRGKTYGLRVHEWRKFIDLPRRVAEPLEIALDIHLADHQDQARLAEEGWRLVDPRAVAGDPESYRHYVQGSRAEFSVAKNIYVDTNSGWFSDRSACYLASGRPVVTRETGFSRCLPTGEGLLFFSTPDEAAAAIAEVAGDYSRHARAAHAIADEYFASDKVLRRLLGDLGVA